MLEPSRLLGFYQGFPTSDGSTGFARLQARLGIHLDPEAVMISSLGMGLCDTGALR